jgi:hypothetical protein
VREDGDLLLDAGQQKYVFRRMAAGGDPGR